MTKEQDWAKIETLLWETYDGGRPFDMAKHLVANGIGDIVRLTRQLEESERFRAADKKILDDYIDREYNPENPEFEERI